MVLQLTNDTALLLLTRMPFGRGLVRQMLLRSIRPKKDLQRRLVRAVGGMLAVVIVLVLVMSVFMILLTISICSAAQLVKTLGKVMFGLLDWVLCTTWPPVVLWAKLSLVPTLMMSLCVSLVILRWVVDLD